MTPRILVLLALFTSTIACSREQTRGDFMFLRIRGADLPVSVQGNTESGVFIVWLTSGPGDPVDVMQGAWSDELAHDYALVFWDQRGCGSAQGNPAPSTFTIDRFAADTDAVIELIRYRYEVKRIFLVGHSWGGTLAIRYLLDPDRQAKITGFIDLAGNHDVPRVYPMKLAWLRRYAEERVTNGSDVDHWRDVVGWVDSAPPLSRKNLHRWESLLERTNAAFHDPSQDFDISFDLLFRSPASAFAYLVVNRHNVEAMLYSSDAVLYEHSYSDRMGAITLPTAFLWGRHDGVVPIQAANTAFDAIGTPNEHKRMVVFEQSAHFPFLEEPEAFADAVKQFVEAYRSGS